MSITYTFWLYANSILGICKMVRIAKICYVGTNLLASETGDSCGWHCGTDALHYFFLSLF